LIHKAQKEQVFNHKLERENEDLKRKVSEFSRLLEAERTEKLAQNLIMGVVSNVGLGNNNFTKSTNDYTSSTNEFKRSMNDFTRG
jgi:hypothetical protein